MATKTDQYKDYMEKHITEDNVVTGYPLEKLSGDVDYPAIFGSGWAFIGFRWRYLRH